MIKNALLLGAMLALPSALAAIESQQDIHAESRGLMAQAGQHISSTKAHITHLTTQIYRELRPHLTLSNLIVSAIALKIAYEVYKNGFSTLLNHIGIGVVVDAQGVHVIGGIHT